MVRVVSQSFNHPRSRHSSGETDLDLALRADAALALNRVKRTDLLDCESSSDSFWDSELDIDHHEHLCQSNGVESDINGNRTSDKSDVTAKRKERRRERNKVSAQAYRQRKRQDNNSTHNELSMLEERNKQLLRQVHALEEKTEQAKQFIKGQRVGAFPDFLFPTKIETLSAPSSPSVLFEAQGSPDNSNHSLSPPSPLSINLNRNSQQFAFDKTHQNSQTIPNSNLNSINLNLPQATTVNLNVPQVHSVNLNAPQVTSFNLNSLGAEGFTSMNSETLHLPSSSTAFPVVKPKQHHFNANNHYYKVPIHHSKVLRTVPELPSNFTHENDDNHFSLPNSNNPQESVNDRSKDCYSEANNTNINLNMNERVGRTLMSNDNREMFGQSCNNANALKVVNMNDNDNLVLSNSNKPHLQNSPHLIVHPNSFVQLIIASGEKQMPSK